MNTPTNHKERTELIKQLSKYGVVLEWAKIRDANKHEVNRYVGAIADFILADRSRAVEAAEAKHQAIYEWLLGMSGDLPLSQPGTRYNWRSELRARLPNKMLYLINARLNNSSKGEDHARSES